MEPNDNHVPFCDFLDVQPLAQADVTDPEGLLLWIIFFLIGEREESCLGCLNEGWDRGELQEITQVLGGLNDAVAADEDRGSHFWFCCVVRCHFLPRTRRPFAVWGSPPGFELGFGDDTLQIVGHLVLVFWGVW